MNPPPGSTDPERFATVSIGIGDRVLFHPAPREPRHKWCEVSSDRASGCKTLANKQSRAVRRLIWARSDCKRLVYDPSLHSSAARDSFGANAHSAALQPQKATAGVEHPTLRVAALITAIGTKNTEPPGAGDTTETSLPPSEQSISRDDATSARRPLTTQHTGPRPRRN